MPLDILRLTANDLQNLLTAGKTTSAELVPFYLDQIDKYDGYLHAMVDIAPREGLLELAERLDQERKAGSVRGHLHGIPIIIKDNIATHHRSGMRTTAGNQALALAKSGSNAKLVDKLLSAGAIVIGKSSLSELSYWKGSGLPCGWSAVKGQGQSAYVHGGYSREDGTFGHSNPGGSSSGSAIAVSAGYAPIAIGTDSEGSLTTPAGRAGLYTVKPTIGSVSTEGIVPISHHFDQAGPLAKSVQDVADLLDVLFTTGTAIIPDNGFASHMVREWKEISVATLDLDSWYPPAQFRKPVPEAEKQMREDQEAAYAKIKKLAKKYHANTPLGPASKLQYKGEAFVPLLYSATHESNMNKYLAGLESSPVRSLKELVAWNKANSDTELPQSYEAQDLLENSVAYEMPAEEVENVLDLCRRTAGPDGFDKIFNDLEVDVIIGPGESALTQFASCAGYPIGTFPIGQLKYNGRPHGLSAIARPHEEATLIKVLSAWEATFVGRPVPDLERNAGRMKL